MRVLLILAASAAAAGCTTPVDAPQSSAFGLAVASMDAQIIPAAVSDLPPETSGARSTLAIARYQKGEPKKLENQTTSDLNVTLVPYAGK
jgi:hypothetical protein